MGITWTEDAPIGSGIYAIQNTVNGKVYVGKTINFRARWKCHRKELRSGKHGNIHLRAAWAKYGGQSFVFRIIEEIPASLFIYLGQQEARWSTVLEALNRKKGYNLAVVLPEGTFTISEETRIRLRTSHLGKKIPPEVVARSAEAHRGLKRTALTKSRMSAANRGQKMTPDQCTRLSAAKLGRPLSDEHRAKLRASNRRKILTNSDRCTIRNRLRAGENRVTLATEFGVHPCYISTIRRGTTKDRRVNRTLILAENGAWVTTDSSKLRKRGNMIVPVNEPSKVIGADDAWKMAGGKP